MILKDECGDRKCTLEEMEMELHRFTTRYGELDDEQRRRVIDSLAPGETRTKTEIDEFGELVAAAKQKGSEAWEGLRSGVVKSYEKVREAFSKVDS